MADSTNTFKPCCLTSFQWDGTPEGREEKLAGLPTYVTGDNPKAAVLYVHDALGWQFGNARLLADHYATEANVTVYIPDFFGGEVLDRDAIFEGRWADLNIADFRARNERSIREPQIFAAAAELRSNGFEKIGAAGFCFGGWGVLRLAQASLVDAIICAHPSWVTNEDFDNINVPVLFLAPEKDANFPDEMKVYAFQTLLGRKSTPFEWVHFPGVAHGCLTKGDEKVQGERAAMVKGKETAVRWWREWLE
ncbi:dienelactone hydrolase family protein [Macroventuria anomochaeta]|uniref:Dienelactone hydrolase family protein n=1 Tax=Macroventuria anomochaeta TaxID=301207 RepID=A0ACB6RXW4_9PLEO|nr:dienelactone hydrolase family protein [Macroventuria anomochaeta]KAF2626716.1 dienelactone hydrolase family protein [Macroventuria anomochaeta]